MSRLLTTVRLRLNFAAIRTLELSCFPKVFETPGRKLKDICSVFQVVASTVEEEEVAEVLPPADDGKVEEEGRRSRNEEEDDRVASAKIDEPSEEERTAGFVNLDRSTDDQVEEDIAAEDDRSAVNSPRETVPLQSEPEKENDDETDVVRRDDEEARDGVVEELEAGKTSPEEDPSKENGLFSLSCLLSCPDSSEKSELRFWS